MKKSILLSAIIFVLSFTIYAQNDTLYIMKSGVVVGKYNVNTQVDSVIFYRPQTQTYFSGITKYNEMGILLSNPDTTDWRFDDNWTTKEEDLFVIKNIALNQKCSTHILIYPNPFQNIFRINLNNMPASSRLAIRLVDKDFKVILKNDSLHGSVTLWPRIINGLDTISIASRDTLRLYYKLIDSLNRELKGHGDILIKK